MNRLYRKILNGLIEKECSNLEEEEQNILRVGRYSTNNIFCLKEVIEKKTTRNQKIHIIFIDLQKAYDISITKL